jgi:hypothetical protein
MLQDHLLMMEDVEGDDTPLQLLQPSQLLQHVPQPASTSAGSTQSSLSGVLAHSALAPALEGAAVNVREARQSIGTLAQFLSGQLTDAAAGYVDPVCTAGGSADSGCQENHTSMGASSAPAAAASMSATVMLVPTEPASIFEASIAARPNFEARQQPPACWYYQLVNALILCVLVAGAVVELTTGKEL